MTEEKHTPEPKKTLTEEELDEVSGGLDASSCKLSELRDNTSPLNMKHEVREHV